VIKVMDYAKHNESIKYAAKAAVQRLILLEDGETSQEYPDEGLVVESSIRTLWEEGYLTDDDVPAWWIK
jgi:hypothetical protein